MCLQNYFLYKRHKKILLFKQNIVYEVEELNNFLKNISTCFEIVSTCLELYLTWDKGKYSIDNEKIE